MLIENGTIFTQFFGTAFVADELFRDLTPDAEKNLRSLARRQLFGADEIVFARGAKPSCVYLLREGSAQIILRDDEPARLTVKNEILGLTEALSDLPHEATVRTVTPCSLDCIAREDFADFLQKEPEVCFRLLKILGTNLQKLFHLLR